MAASNTSSIPVQRFGGFEVDPRSRELCRDGIRIRMQPQPLDVLLLLLVRKGEVVTREELQDRLWPAGTFVDADDGLNTAIRKLREILGDSAECPVYIETIPRLGYRFIGPVEEGGSRPIATPESTALSSVTVPTGGETVPAGVPASRTKTFPLLQLLVAAVGLACAVWYLQRPLPPPRISDSVQITHDGHPKDLVATDGSRLYLSFSFSGPPRIAQVAIAGGEIAPFLVPLPNPFLHDVSQDGSSFLVASEENGQRSLWDLQVPGGTVRRMANGVIQSAAWSPDGRSMVYGTPANDIFMVRRDGTDLRKLVAADDHNRAWVWNFAWSPDGANIRFNRGYKLWEVSSDGSGLHQVLPGWRPSSYLFCGRWTPDGKFFLFLARDHPSTAVRQLWALDERRTSARQTPSDPVQLTSGPIFWDRPIPGRDGKKIFASGFIRRGEMVRYDAPTRELKPWLGGISAEHLSYSPDGKSIVYVSYPEGILWRANRDGTNPIQLTGPPFYPLNPRWSPDGSKILFCSDQDQGGGDYRIYIVSSQGGTPQPILPDDRGPQSDPNWSPDGQRIIFASGVPHTPEVVLRILDLASHQIVTLPGSQGIWSPRWSPDGRLVAGINGSGGCSIFNFDSQQWSELQKGECNYPTFSSNSKFVYFISVPLDGVYRVGVSGGRVEGVVDLKGFHHVGAVSLWMGLDPTDTPMLLRDRGSADIYALTLEEK